MSNWRIVFGIALLIAVTAAPAWSATYIPTYSDGKYRGCTYYDDNGEPVRTYLNVSLLSCVVAGILNTQLGPAARAAQAPAPIEEQALASLPIDDPAQLAKELESAKRNLEEAAMDEQRAAADLARINRLAKKMKPDVLRQRLLRLQQAQGGAGQ
ncbi:MAG TPA: hypothetical protein VF179_24105 [Thermoanaerobaculia bacterium]|nr:hypothetical protein [Thermoanaerobaculia bacterium]